MGADSGDSGSENGRAEAMDQGSVPKVKITGSGASFELKQTRESGEVRVSLKNWPLLI